MLELVGIAVVVGSPVHAQTTTDPHRWAGGLSIDLGGIPDEFGERCGGNNSTAVYGVGLTVVNRPRRGLVAIFDARANSVMPFGGCNKAFVSPVVAIGANEFEEGPFKTYPNGTPSAPLRRTSVRVGVEAPPGRGVLRATIGGGWLWSGAQQPFVTGAIELGTNNDGPRLVAGLERSIAWIRVDEEYRRYRDVGDTRILLPSRIDGRTTKKQWTIARLGLELPLVR